MGGLDGPPKPPGARKRPGAAVALLEFARRPRGPRRAPQAPRRSEAPRRRRGAPRVRAASPRASTGPQTPGAPRVQLTVRGVAGLLEVEHLRHVLQRLDLLQASDPGHARHYFADPLERLRHRGDA